MPRCAVSLRAPLRIEMKGVCNESHSARVPDPTAVRRLRRENQRDGEGEGRETRGQRWREEEAQGTTQGLFFFLTTTPPFIFCGVWLPSCDNVKLAFLLVYGEQCGTATQSRTGERFEDGDVSEKGEVEKKS